MKKVVIDGSNPGLPLDIPLCLGTQSLKPLKCYYMLNLWLSGPGGILLSPETVVCSSCIWYPALFSAHIMFSTYLDIWSGIMGLCQ
jgi:hypothetical protein